MGWTDNLQARTLSEILTFDRSTHSFTTQEVSDAMLHSIFDLMKWGPTSFNSQPARFHFLRSAASREKLLPALSGSNREKTRRAPMTVLVSYSTRFYEELSPGVLSDSVLQVFRESPALALETALRSSTLQGAYFMLAARSVGLGVGPMSGFDPKQVNQAFLAGRHRCVNFLINLGYPTEEGLRPRGVRFSFSEVATIE
jgi:3-hydroxypropanoate dehydrogenase